MADNRDSSTWQSAGPEALLSGYLHLWPRNADKSSSWQAGPFISFSALGPQFWETSTGTPLALVIPCACLWDPEDGPDSRPALLLPPPLGLFLPGNLMYAEPLPTPGGLAGQDQQLTELSGALAP